MNESYPFHVIDLMKGHGGGEIRCPPKGHGREVKVSLKGTDVFNIELLRV